MGVNLIDLVKEKGVEEGAKEMKNRGCTRKYGINPPLNACYYTEDCEHCWNEALLEIRFRYLR
ncbi:TPA: hypothetical protein N2D99_002469 [Clostridium botulinum]|nr:hypothetical protein [Clostridium botulinum]